MKRSAFLRPGAVIIDYNEIRLYGPYLFVRMFQVRLSCLCRRRRGRGRTFRHPNHRLRRLQGAPRRGGPIQSIATAQGKSAQDRAEICCGVEPSAAARGAPMAEIQTGLSRLAITSHPYLETAGQMSEVWNFFGAKRHSVPHLGLSLKPKAAAAVSRRTLGEWRGLTSAATDKKGGESRHDDAQLFALDREGRGQMTDPLPVQFKGRLCLARQIKFGRL